MMIWYAQHVCAQVCMPYDMIRKWLRVASLKLGLRALFMLRQEHDIYVDMIWQLWWYDMHDMYFTLYGLYQGWAP